MKNDIILLEHLKVLQQKLSSTKVPNRKKIIKESLQITDISNQSNFKFRKMKNNKYFIFHKFFYCSKCVIRTPPKDVA